MGPLAMMRWRCAVLLACACGAPTTGTTLFVTSALDGDDPVSIAVITDGSRIAAYACASDMARDPYPGWFIGDVAPDGRFALSLDGWSFVGAIEQDRARGTIHEPDGSVVPWSSSRTSQSTLTGLYKDDSDPTTCSATVIVLADDPTQPPIVRGAWCDVMQVTPVVPIALVGDRMAVDVPMPKAPLRLYVSPVRTVPR
jgi:hypothetical protein